MISQVELGIHPENGLSIQKSPYQALGHPSDTGSLGNGIRAGDMVRFDENTALAVLNRCAQMFYEATHESTSAIEPVMATLEKKLSAFRSHVGNKENYQPDAQNRVINRYSQAEALPAASMQERVSNRLAEFNTVHVVTDLDGTITTDPPQYLEKIPGSKVAERVLEEKGRDSFIEVFARTWQPLLEHAPYLFQQAGQNAPIREGVAELMQLLEDSGIQKTVVSANFEPFVNAVLSRAVPKGCSIDTFAVQSHNLISLDKGTLLRHFAQSNPDNALIFIGDGSSDIPALDANDVVGCYFALKGSSFAKELEKRGLPYFSYTDFHDITNQMRHLNVFAKTA